MTIFFLALFSFLAVLMCWQAIVSIRLPRMSRSRPTILLRVVFLCVVFGLCIYVWRVTLFKEIAFTRVFLPYPEARLSVFETPIFSQEPYWTYHTEDSADKIFNWYRGRAKHAGWIVAENNEEGKRIFVVHIDKAHVVFVVLSEDHKGTTITYTTEGTLTKKE